MNLYVLGLYGINIVVNYTPAIPLRRVDLLVFNKQNISIRILLETSKN